MDEEMKQRIHDEVTRRVNIILSEDNDWFSEVIEKMVTERLAEVLVKILYGLKRDNEFEQTLDGDTTPGPEPEQRTLDEYHHLEETDSLENYEAAFPSHPLIHS